MANEPQELPEGTQVMPIPLTPVHVSSIEVSIVGNDFGLVFAAARYSAAILGNQRQTLAQFDPVAIISMSPGTAKDLAHLLVGIVQRYEQEFGPISTPFLKAQVPTEA